MFDLAKHPNSGFLMGFNSITDEWARLGQPEGGKDTGNGKTGEDKGLISYASTV